MHRKHGTRHRSMGGATGSQISSGKPDAMISGNRRNMPSEALSSGRAEASRGGASSKSLALGRSTGKTGRFHEKYADGGHAVDMGMEKKGERLKLARKRDGILEEPAFKRGGLVHKTMRSIYEALHGHFENEPQMRKLRVTKADVSEGEPHHFRRK